MRSGQNTDFNSSLKELWSEEFGKWQATIDDFFSPLFQDQQELAMVREAYMKIFTVKSFQAPSTCVSSVLTLHRSSG